MILAFDTMAILDAMSAIFTTVCKYAGILFLVFAIIQFLMAFKDGDASRNELARKFFVWGMVGLFASLLIEPIITGAEALVNMFWNAIQINK